jgi:hypothetical protein
VSDIVFRLPAYRQGQLASHCISNALWYRLKPVEKPETLETPGTSCGMQRSGVRRMLMVFRVGRHRCPSTGDDPRQPAFQANLLNLSNSGFPYYSMVDR